jgi:N-carbamoylputrescine amidase
MTRCAFVEWPEDLQPAGPAWETLRRAVDAARPDLLVTNELPFGPWLASRRDVDRDAASRSVALHEAGLDALSALGVPAVVSSRPVWAEGRLVNEAFALEAGQIRPLHRKQYFPEEAGWFEASWFMADDSGFALHEVAGLKLGVLLCTELMFNERARHYGVAGADLIVAPRASGTEYRCWTIAGAMAAIVAGSYVVSSNRIGRAAGPDFGGKGFAFSPDGALLAETSADAPLRLVALDAAIARRQKAEYPCYVAAGAARDETPAAN